VSDTWATSFARDLSSSLAVHLAIFRQFGLLARDLPLLAMLALAALSPWRWGTLRELLALLGQEEVSWQELKAIASTSTKEAARGITDIPVVLLALLLMLR